MKTTLNISVAIIQFILFALASNYIIDRNWLALLPSILYLIFLLYGFIKYKLLKQGH